MRNYSSSALQDAALSYQQSIRNIPLLSVEEERELAYRVQLGEQDSRKQMVQRNLRLVLSLARRQEHRGLSLPDLVSEGQLGLIRAVEKFEPQRGFRFSTYATLWIRQSIDRAVMNQERTVRLPIHVIKQIGRCLRARYQLSQRLGREPSLRELALDMQMAPDKLRQLLNWHGAPSGDDSDTGFVSSDEIEDCSQDPDRNLEAERLRRQVKQWLARLSPRQRAVVARRFGFHRSDDDTLERIGDHVGLTRERVRQILLGALAQMRDMAAEQGVLARDQL